MNISGIQPAVYQKGMSLIEILVALIISGLLLLGVSTVYTASKRSYQTNDEIASMQENARFALQTLTQNIRMSGFIGCSSLNENVSLVNNIDDPDNPGNPNPLYDVNLNTVAVGHQDTGAWNPPLPVTPGNIVAGTSAISIRRGSNCAQKLAKDMISLTDPVTVTTTVNCKYDVDQPVIVTDCYKSDIFMITAVTPAGGTLQLEHGAGKNYRPTLSQSYSTAGKSFVLSMYTKLYYIGTNPGGGTSLYEVVNGSAPTELIPNVADMVIRYGRNSDNDLSVDRVEKADAVPANSWSKVLNVYVRLLMASDPVGTAGKSYTFDGQVFDGVANPLPGDTRYRKEFVTTINLRNRTTRGNPNP
ncbi:MAG: PilW family protein [Gammaproteobacteria bacterium]|nr:PilW family protein [Gammaproteobacteria bacterium]MDH5651156.1 PilW family protein [Gammaproteobacteria bacterium]